MHHRKMGSFQDSAKAPRAWGCHLPFFHRYQECGDELMGFLVHFGDPWLRLSNQYVQVHHIFECIP